MLHCMLDISFTKNHHRGKCDCLVLHEIVSKRADVYVVGIHGRNQGESSIHERVVVVIRDNRIVSSLYTKRTHTTFATRTEDLRDVFFERKRR